MRNVVGVAAGVFGLVLYACAAVALADDVRGAPALVELLYYVVAGVAWVPAARWLMLWTARQRRIGRF